MHLSLHLFDLPYLIVFHVLIPMYHLTRLCLFVNKIGLSLVKYCPMLGLLLFTCPPILGLRGKNAVGPFLPFRHLNDLLLDFF